MAVCMLRGQGAALLSSGDTPRQSSGEAGAGLFGDTFREGLNHRLHLEAHPEDRGVKENSGLIPLTCNKADMIPENSATSAAI